MLSNVTAKIKSAPRSLKILGGTICAALIIAIISTVILANQKPSVSVNGHRYAVRVADTAALRTKGLSDTPSLPQKEGMLFVFPRATRSCFWMKDMHYSLDMIWLNANKKIVHIARNVTPQSYPDSFCTSTPATYVLELNAGEANRSSMLVGQYFSF